MADVRQDTFNRPDQTGWGTASDGHVWAQQAGFTSVVFDGIASNRGVERTVTNANGPVLLLGPALSADDVQLLVRWSISAANTPPSNNVIYILLRWNSISDPSHGIEVYQGLPRGSLLINDGANTSPPEVAASRSAETVYATRIIAQGTLYQWRTWLDGASEPSGWDQTFTSAVGGLGRSVGIRFAQSPIPGAESRIHSFLATTALGTAARNRVCVAQ